MTDFARGQKSKLADIGCAGAFPLTLSIAAQGMAVDIACFGLDANDKLSDDRYMVFFNQKACPGDAVILELAAESATFKLDLARLPATIHKLVFTASITGAGVMRTIGASVMRLGDASFAFSGADFQDEKAIIVGELYQRDGLWRVGAVGQGFNDGLDALVKHFGGSVSEPEPAAPPPPKSASVNLEKVSGKVQLTKNSKSIIIEKTPEMTASISWQTGTDYDVYALVYTRDGKQIDVSTFGAKNTPILTNFDNGAVVHMGDVGRQGGATKTEVITIKLNDKILAIVPVAYSAQSNGTGSFRRYKVSMLIDNNKGTAVTITADNANEDDTIYTCVPGMILNGSDGIVIKPLELYSEPGSENRPKLIKEKDGAINVVMDAGPLNDYK